MSLILNLETSTKICSVSLSVHGEVIACREVGGEYTHAENLTRFIETVCTDSGKTLEHLSAVSVCIGPGSYTGLRIGLSTAKGLCFALNKPLITLNSLEVLAHAPIPETTGQHAALCPMLDARRMEVYCAVYSPEREELEAVSAQVIDETSFLSFLEKGQVIFFGDGAEKCKALIRHPNAVFLPELLSSSKYMAALSERALAGKQFADLAYTEPLYLKEFQAGKKKQTD